MKYASVVLIFALLTIFIGCRSRTSNPEHTSHNSTANGAATDDAAPDDHSTMTSSPGAASAPIELQFLDSMIAHHEGAVDMAELAEKLAERSELEDFAANIVDEQERQISKMDQWRDGWFEGKADALNMEFPGMSQGMSGMDLKKLGSLKGHEFDVEFLRQMIPHHEGAVTMAKAIKSSGARPELTELADEIITAQEAEIGRMREWLAAWAK